LGKPPIIKYVYIIHSPKKSTKAVTGGAVPFQKVNLSILGSNMYIFVC